MASRKPAAVRPALDTKVRALRDLGHRTHCTIHAGVGQRSTTFARCPDGHIYSTRAGDIARRGHYSEIERKAWCALKGVTMKALKLEMAAQDKRDEAQRKANALAEVTRKANDLGLKVIKARAKPGAGSVHAARLLGRA